MTDKDMGGVHPLDTRPAALGWINADVSAAPDRDKAAVQQLADRLGYRLVWPDEISVLPVSAQLHSLGADTVLMPAPDHLGPLELSRVMEIADVETVHPRLSFARWSIAGAVAEAGSC
ncbi:hypothetical protein [Nocardia testacea]|uniref:hypothetical protein n=1 Tax=Nocardia testacea TaxID=248551 RepID=UPI0002DC7EB3|nr:hypothetical protein [Nocardia testacea]